MAPKASRSIQSSFRKRSIGIALIARLLSTKISAREHATFRKLVELMNVCICAGMMLIHDVHASHGIRIMNISHLHGLAHI